MAEMFASNGYNFYAVDLRKYGRSLIAGQKMFQVRRLDEYFADINATIKIMARYYLGSPYQTVNLLIT